jgi:hypothetical protein
MTLPVIVFNIIFQEAGYFENSTISSSLGWQALCFSRKLHKFQAWKMTIVTVIHFVRKFDLYFSTPAVTGDW